MKKIKNIFLGIGTFFTGLSTEIITANAREVQNKYGVRIDPSNRPIESNSNIPGVVHNDPSIGQKICTLGKFMLPAILFIIGIFVLFNKKLTPRTKAMIVFIIAVAAVAAYFIMNYLITIL